MRADPDLSGVHVMLVDDNEDALHIFGSYLEHLGAVVTVARNGAAALGLRGQRREQVTVTALSMPGTHGVEVVGRPRGHRAQAEDPTPVIAITAFPEDYRGEAMHDLGFKSYMVKPVNPERVARE